MRGIILAAGLGTRLRPLTEHYPKPLVEVAGRPLIEWGLLSLAEAGISEVGINHHYHGSQLTEHFSRERLNYLNELASHVPKRLVWSHEKELLGTGGGVAQLWQLLRSSEEDLTPLVCLNGDALFDFDLTSLIATHHQSQALGTLALREVAPGDPFGRVGVDANNRVVRIAEVKGPRSHEEVRVGAFTGVQVITHEVARRLPVAFCDTFRTAHREILDLDLPIQAHFVPPTSVWLDIGNLERYWAAHTKIIDHQIAWFDDRFPGESTQCSRIARTADISSEVEIGEGVWIGEHTVIRGSGRIEQSILWSGSVIDMSRSEPPILQNSVITPKGIFSLSR